MQKRIGFGAGSLILALALVACGDDGQNPASTPPAGQTVETKPTESTPTSAGSAPNLSVGPGLALGGASVDSPTSSLPGCSDPNDDACPAPVDMDLDGEATARGVRVSYPARYFTATPYAEGDILIEIAPSENNRFAERAVFQVYFADSIEAALSALENPETAAWSNATLSGTVGVARDSTQDPPVNTTIGAFSLADGRVIVLKLTTTGKYGWDLWMRVYEDMLNTLAVTD